MELLIGGSIGILIGAIVEHGHFLGTLVGVYLGGEAKACLSDSAPAVGEDLYEMCIE